MNIKPRILKGFRDCLPKEMIQRERMISTIKRCFERHGFSPLSTPALEYSEILTGKYGDEGDKLLYRFTDNGGRDVALRYDLTVPLARLIGQYRDIVLPLRRYQIAEVWRAEKPARGRFREFIQCDVDIVGASSPIADAEIISAGIDALLSLGLSNFTVRINHRGILNAVLIAKGITEKEKQIMALRALDKLEKQGLENILKELRETAGLDERTLACFTVFLNCLNDLRNLDSLEGIEAAENLRETLKILSNSGFGDYIEFDPTIARGLDYYTGAIFETSLNDLPGFGSVMSGGRYNKLIGMFARHDIPAVGISIGLDRLFSALVELKMTEERETVTKVLICPAGSSLALYAASIARKLRDSGINTEIYHNPPDKIGKQIGYAGRKGIPFVVILGEKELQEGRCSLKDLGSGEQKYLTVEDVIRILS